MLPVDILISEHVLIIRVVDLTKKETEQIKKTMLVKLGLITDVVNFFRIYADRYHHGKEEGILFKALSQKKLSEADHKMFNELIMEHALARRTVASLEKAKENYAAGKAEALQDIVHLLNILTELYPKHIEKEDKQFFYPAMQYFSQEEQNAMLKSSQQFDQDFTNKQYKQFVDTMEKQIEAKS